MKYTFASGSRIKADPQAAGEMCEELERTGGLTAKRLVEANRAKDAPLHNCFEWNNKKAADLYREGQARHIINCIIVVPEETNEPIRKFFNIEYKEPEYKSIEVILKNEDDTEKLFQRCLAELNAVRKKYAAVQKAASVFNAIDQLTIDFHSRMKGGET